MSILPLKCPLNYHPLNCSLIFSNVFFGKRLLNISTNCRFYPIFKTLIFTDLRHALNQWYFTAKSFDLGVIRGSYKFAKESAPALSSNTLHQMLNCWFFSSPTSVKIIWINRLKGNKSLIASDNATYFVSIRLSVIPYWRWVIQRTGHVLMDNT